MKKSVKKKLNDWKRLPEVTLEEWVFIEGPWTLNFTPPNALEKVKKRKRR